MYVLVHLHQNQYIKNIGSVVQIPSLCLYFYKALNEEAVEPHTQQSFSNMHKLYQLYSNTSFPLTGSTLTSCCASAEHFACFLIAIQRKHSENI